jgi:hypothetical protein
LQKGIILERRALNLTLARRKVRRRRRIRIRLDILIVTMILAGMVGAAICWPDKLLADVAISTAFLVAFTWWQNVR